MATNKPPQKTTRATRKVRTTQKPPMQNKGVTQGTASNELNNFLSSSDFAILCLDRQLCLKWFTPGMLPLFKFRRTDIGRTINEFSATVIGTGLNRDAKAVLKKHLPLAREIRLPNGLWYLRRILPYHNDHQAISSIIIKFTDISESKRNTEALLLAQQQLADSLEHRVQERTQQLRDLSVELVLAEERERRTLARDLHDDLGQLLAVAKIKIAALSKHETVTEQQHRVDEIKQILDKAHTAVQSLTFQLSPPILYELGLIPALEWLGEEMLRLYGLHVTLKDDGKPKPLTVPVSTILFRAVRELLINVAKHANVNTAHVATKSLGKMISIKVADAGSGFHPHHKQKMVKGKTGGFGLLNVRERLSYIDGEMRTESIPGDGTLITLLAPLAPKTRAKETNV